MATLTIDIPDALVPDLARTWIKAEAKRVLLEYRGAQAALTARADKTDPAVTW